MWLDVGGLNSMMDDLGDAVSDSIRPAAQAGAQVFYDRAKQYVGAMGRVTGNLSNAIYQAYSESNSGQDKATYHVSWNHIKAPHGQLLEYGHWQRYQVILTSNGWKTMTRPGKLGLRSLAAVHPRKPRTPTMFRALVARYTSQASTSWAALPRQRQRPRQR